MSWFLSLYFDIFIISQYIYIHSNRLVFIAYKSYFLH